MLALIFVLDVISVFDTLVEHLPDAHALGIALQVLARGNGNAVQALGGGEYALGKDLVQGEVLAQFLLVEREVAGADLGFPVGPVGGVEVLLVERGFLG